MSHVDEVNLDSEEYQYLEEESPIDIQDHEEYESYDESQGSASMGSKRKDRSLSPLGRGKGRGRGRGGLPPLPAEKGRAVSSKVWNEFEKVKIGPTSQDVVAKCTHCKKELSGKSKSGTTHLFNHLKTCPIRKTKNIGPVDLRQTTLSFVKKEDGSTEMATWHYNQAQVRKAIAEMVIVHEYPLSMVEHIKFRKMMGVAQPLFQPYSRNTLRADILKMYEDEKVRFKACLHGNKGKIGLTTDMWTSGTQQRGYMAVIAHFIDNDWKLQNRLLRYVISHVYLCMIMFCFGVLYLEC